MKGKHFGLVVLSLGVLVFLGQQAWVTQPIQSLIFPKSLAASGQQGVGLGTSTAPTNGLDGYWALDGTSGLTAVDSSGNGNTGTLMNGATWTPAGVINGAVSLNTANSSYVSVPSSASLTPTKQLTVALWAKTTNLAETALVSKWIDNAPVQQGWLFRIRSDGSIRVNLSGTTTDTVFAFASTAGNVWTPNVWHHVAFVYDGTQASNAAKVQIYLDGVALPTTVTGTLPAAIAPVTTPVTFGDIDGTPGRALNGSIDEVRMYSRPLSASEILSVMDDHGLQQNQLPSQVATPSISPFGGSFTSTQTVSLSDTTAGASIYYTTDASTPTTSSTLYTGPFTVAVSQTVKAIGVAPNLTNSATASATFTIAPPAAPVVISFTATPQSITSGQSTTLAWSVSGATSLVISSGVGSQANVSSGSVVVSPTQTTTYTLTATGTGGTATAQATVTVTPVLVSVLDKPYSTRVAARQFSLYYVPSPTYQSNPIVIFIHGGGWTSGTKDDSGYIPDFTYLAQNGFNVYSIDYSLAVSGQPATQWPAQMQDIDCMLSYLGSGNAVGDSNRISVWGYSAGAHLGLMAGLTQKNQFSGNCEWTGTNYTINSVESLAGPTDLNALYSIGDSTATAAIPVLLGYAPPANPAGAAAASPITYVSNNAPPILLAGGSIDTTVPPAQSLELATALSNSGDTVDRVVINGQTHNLDYQSVNGVSFPLAANFILQYGKALLHTTNVAPVVSAGANQSLTLPVSSTTLAGSATDDGLPNPPAALTYSWVQVSGPASATFATPTAATTTVSGLTAVGSYVFQLTASDSLLASSASVTVSVNPALDVTPPVVTLSAQDSTGQSLNIGSTVDGAITFAVNATDPTVANQVNSGVASVQVVLDGKVVQSAAGSSLTYSLNTNTLLSTAHTLLATATDAAGNVAISQPFQLGELGFSVVSAQ